MLHPIGVIDHHAGVSRNAITMKCRLCQSSLPVMKVAFARQQAVTQHRFCALEPASLLEGRMVGDKHVFDVLRIIDQEILLGPRLEVSNVPKLVRGGHEESDWITAECE